MRLALAMACLAMAALSGCAWFEQLKSDTLCHSRRGRATSVRCALSPSQQLSCWGSNEQGQVGNDGTWSYYGGPERVVGLGTVSTFAEGEHYHACAVTTAGELYCWGENNSGMLGKPVQDRTTYLDETYGTPQRVPLPERALAVEAGFAHTCAVTASQQLYCWGSNDQGQLGFSRATHDQRPGCEPALLDDGSFCDRPQRVALDHVVAVALGSFHTCALTAEQRVHCWGIDDWGTLGSESLVELPDARAIAARGGRTCAVTTAGDLYCWGVHEGRLGDMGLDRHARPTRVAGLPAVAAVTVGTSHLCAVTRPGGLYCLGMNDVGQLGLGEGWERRPGCRWLHNSRCIGADILFCNTPQRVALEGVRRVHASDHATVAETSSGIYFWGSTENTDYVGLPSRLELE